MNTKKVNLEHRIRRIKGQIAGVENMMENKRDCLEIVQQISAVRAALAKLASLVLVQECEKLVGKKQMVKIEATLNKLFKNI
jgi:CsoR family transcriptional regulator, copper-sensing transcriptional repressor